MDAKTQKNSVFSKALFKQSCKANGTMWGIITFAVCFMLCCVMLINGSGNIGKTKDAIQDTIIQKEVESSFKTRGVNYYANQSKYLASFDSHFAEETKTVYQTAYIEAKTAGKSDTEAAVAAQAAVVGGVERIAQSAANDVQAEISADVTATYLKTLNKSSVDELTASEKKALNEVNVPEVVGVFGFAVNPANEELATITSQIPDKDKSQLTAYVDTEYVTGMLTALATDKTQEYLLGRQETINDRAEVYSSMFLAANMSTDKAKNALLDALKDYGVTTEKYESFGYDYDKISDMARTATITYRGRYDYEVAELKEKLDGKVAGGTLSVEDYATEYENGVNAIVAELYGDIASSLLSSLPGEVSDALKEVGELDLYSLIVGSIFYKLAGLLLPIIYVIMASNNLIAGQVDSGSMAYVLSTSTKRRTVVFTQAVYLIGSLLAMFSLTTVTGCVCLAIVKADSTSIIMSYGELILLNLGAFLVLFALSGLCFFTSCWFDRSKRSMAIGGGLSIYSLVGAMLGLFGTQTIPSVVRLDVLNYFNYTTIISLFDSVSIIDGTLTFLWKFAILIVFGVVGYVIGARKFVKKDLPL
ncbi:MAG: ABC transporter permease subunit [Candidatus Borkfalkiaceae bacterium]|nr:ABC transporter permease subunit [Christensenellaceae bacterium]